MPDRATVPCAGCTLCCQGEAIFLHPEHGDIPVLYQTVPAVNPVTQTPSLMLAHKPNGDCIYLDRATGCTIHDRAPAICREFDCRKFYLRIMEFSRNERRRMLKAGLLSRDKLNAGRDRADTL